MDSGLRQNDKKQLRFLILSELQMSVAGLFCIDEIIRGC